MSRTAAQPFDYNLLTVGSWVAHRHPALDLAVGIADERRFAFCTDLLGDALRDDEEGVDPHGEHAADGRTDGWVGMGGRTDGWNIHTAISALCAASKKAWTDLGELWLRSWRIVRMTSANSTDGLPQRIVPVISANRAYDLGE